MRRNKNKDVVIADNNYIHFKVCISVLCGINKIDKIFTYIRFNFHFSNVSD